MTDQERISAITAELRATELLRVLRHAVNGNLHWRIEAKQLLDLIDGGVPPFSYYQHKHRDAA